MASGLIREINVDAVKKALGGPLIKPVSMPKPPDNAEYLKKLSDNETNIFNLYEQIVHSKDEKTLLSYLETGKLKPTTTNKEKITPLMLAIDCSMSVETIGKLIDLGCQINAQADDGMTPLHKAYILENLETFKYLLSRGADPDI